MNLFTRFFSSLGKLANGEVNRGPHSGFSGAKEEIRAVRDPRSEGKTGRAERKMRNR